MSASKVRVCVRCRPLSMREARGRRCVSIANDKVAVGDKTFVFDGVFDDSSTQSEVYDGCVSRLTEGCFEGFNATVLAYGQTGSGKTHSIMGSFTEGEDEEGIIPRVARHVFDILDSKTIESDGKVVASLHVSFIEIYNDECKDLLHPDIQPRDIYIREDKDGKIFFTGAREEQVSSAEGVLELLDRGNRSRTTAETFMNATSSRSHAIFTISMEIYDYSAPAPGAENDEATGVAGGPMEGGAYIQSKIHLVDLAGSERAKKTGAGGQRLKESVGINQGLLSLGKVIRALTTPASKGSNGQPTHVPYRESKLTRFLQDSLGGNSRTVMLACISPAESNLHETLSTLQYANRARAVQNKVTANIAVGIGLTGGPLDALAGGVAESQDGLVTMLRAQLSKMQEEMQLLRRNGGRLGAIEEGDEEFGDDGEKENKRTHDNVLRRTGGKAVVGDVPADEATAAVQELENRLSSMMRVTSQSAYSIQKSLKSMGRAAESPDACGPAWPLVQACQAASSRLSFVIKDCESGLEQILGHQLDYTAADDGNRNNNGSGSGTSRGGDLRASSSTVMRRSLAETLNDMARDEEIRTLRRELEECREDLQRDEEIFAEKVRELKSYRKKLRQIEKENGELKEKLEDAGRAQQQQQWQLRSPVRSPLRRRGGLDDTISVRRSQVDIRWDVEPAPRPTTPKVKTPSPVKRLPHVVGRGDDAIPDDLEISMVVAATEPDISHLIEDLETMAREKEELLREREQEKDRLNSRPGTATSRAEDKDDDRPYPRPVSPEKAAGYVRPLSAVATSTSSLQAEDKMEYSQQKKVARKRLSDLETSISNKQELLAQITAARKDAEDVAEESKARAAALDRECSTLRRELRELEVSRQRIGEEADQERDRRIALEVMLKSAEDQREQLERDRDAELQRVMRAEKEKHVEELRALKDEHARLLAQVEDDERRQRENVHSLTQQMSEYKQTTIDAEGQVRALTQRTADLKRTNEDLFYQLKQLREDYEDQLQVVRENWDTERQQLLKSIRDLEQRSAVPVANSNSSESVSDPEADLLVSGAVASASEEIWEWLNGRVDQLAAVNIARAEITRLKELCLNSQHELAALKDEESKLRRQQESGQASLAKQLVEIEGRIDNLSTQLHERQEVIAEVREELSSCKDPQRRQILIQELATLEARVAESHKHLKSYKAHKEEIADRLKKGVLSAEAAQRFVEIQDEIETMETEYVHTENLLAEEEKSLNLLCIDLNGGSTVKDSSASAPTAMVAQQLSQRLSTALTAAHHSRSLPQPPAATSSSSSSSSSASSRPSHLPQRKGPRSEGESPKDRGLGLGSEAPPAAPHAGRDAGSATVSLRAEGLVQQQLLSKLMQTLADMKARVQRDDGEVESLRAQLDDKSAALEEQISAVQKTRTEFMNKLELQRKEADDKVAYLLQQLRTVEGKLATSRSHSRLPTPSNAAPSTAEESSSADAHSTSSKRGRRGSGGGGSSCMRYDEKQMDEKTNYDDRDQDEEKEHEAEGYDQFHEMASVGRFSHSVAMNQNIRGTASHDDDVLLWTNEAASFAGSSRPITPATTTGLTVDTRSLAVAANTFSPRTNEDAAAALALQLRRMSDNELSKSIQSIKSPASLSRPGSALIPSRPPTASGPRTHGSSNNLALAGNDIDIPGSIGGSSGVGGAYAGSSLVEGGELTIAPEVEQGVREEVVRRWQAEKERRGMLEKRSSDLVKKLRALKMKEMEREREGQRGRDKDTIGDSDRGKDSKQ